MQTDRLILEPCTEAHLLALIQGANAFQEAFGMPVVEGYLEFPEALHAFLAAVRSGTTQSEWPTYLFIHREDHAVIGLGGYIGAPDENGMIEFGYGIAPTYRSQGYATEAAQAIIENAFASGHVSTIRAHTLAQANASTAVLRKNGLIKVGEFDDPDDGKIWRWERIKDQA